MEGLKARVQVRELPSGEVLCSNSLPLSATVQLSVDGSNFSLLDGPGGGPRKARSLHVVPAFSQDVLLAFVVRGPGAVVSVDYRAALGQAGAAHDETVRYRWPFEGMGRVEEAGDETVFGLGDGEGGGGWGGVLAARRGIVMGLEREGRVEVCHGDGSVASYGQLENVAVTEGQAVREGQMLGQTEQLRFAVTLPTGTPGQPKSVAVAFDNGTPQGVFATAGQTYHNSAPHALGQAAAAGGSGAIKMAKKGGSQKMGPKKGNSGAAGGGAAAVPPPPARTGSGIVGSPALSRQQPPPPAAAFQQQQQPAFQSSPMVSRPPVPAGPNSPMVSRHQPPQQQQPNSPMLSRASAPTPSAPPPSNSHQQQFQPNSPMVNRPSAPPPAVSPHFATAGAPPPSASGAAAGEWQGPYHSPALLPVKPKPPSVDRAFKPASPQVPRHAVHEQAPPPQPLPEGVQSSMVPGTRSAPPSRALHPELYVEKPPAVDPNAPAVHASMQPGYQRETNLLDETKRALDPRRHNPVKNTSKKLSMATPTGSDLKDKLKGFTMF